MSLGGRRLYEVAQGVVKDTDDFAATVKALTDHFEPKWNEDYEVFKFRQANQFQNEKFEAFVACLRTLARTCGFFHFGIRHRLKKSSTKNDGNYLSCQYLKVRRRNKD